MEFSVQILENLENHCFSCLGTEHFIDNIHENRAIQDDFKRIFNLEFEVTEGFPKNFCINCQRKLRDAADFLAQVQSSIQYFQHIQKSNHVEEVNVKEENISFFIQSTEEEPEELGNEDNSANCINAESSSGSETDNEPLIKLIPTKIRKKRKNTFNSKLKRISLQLVEEAIQSYREKCKENSNCVLCDFKGLNIRNLSCHMIFKHKQEKDQWCLRCNMMVEDIEGHKKSHNNKIWCKFCKKDVSRCHYVEHLKSHAGWEYSCDKCQKKFISQSMLHEHLARHEQQKPFQCQVCNKAFKLFKSLEDHVLTHGRYKCEACEKNFEIPELLASHLCAGKVTKNQEILLLQAAEKFEENPDAEYHIDQSSEGNRSKVEQEDLDVKNTQDIKHEEDTIKVKPEIEVESLMCHFCQKTYKTAYKLQKHIEAHMGIFLAKCSYCDKGFSSKADLANHERVHTKEKPFICCTCGKGFVSGATLRIHMKQHTGKPEKCELCHKRFCRKSELKLHLQKHRGERPFLCTDCGKSFAQKSHLTCHLTMHSEDRPYSCEVCEKTFKKKELLKHHMKLHGEKKFKCTICFYECHKKYRLQQHMKMHEGKTGIKMNHCQLCTRSFSSVQLLNIHMGNVHSVIV